MVVARAVLGEGCVETVESCIDIEEELLSRGAPISNWCALEEELSMPSGKLNLEAGAGLNGLDLSGEVLEEEALWF